MEKASEKLVDFLAGSSRFIGIEFVEGVTGRSISIDLIFELLAGGAQGCGKAFDFGRADVLIVGDGMQKEGATEFCRMRDGRALPSFGRHRLMEKSGGRRCVLCRHRVR